jgi:hypothetical protein
MVVLLRVWKDLTAVLMASQSAAAAVVHRVRSVDRAPMGTRLNPYWNDSLLPVPSVPIAETRTCRGIVIAPCSVP